MEHIPDAIYFKDTAGRFLRVNRAQAATMGLAQPKDALGKTDFDFQPVELARAFAGEERQIMENGQPIIDRIEYNPTPDGKPRWFSASKAPLVNEAGCVIGTVGISRNITRRMLTEQKLRQSEELFAKAFNASHAGIAITRLRDGKILDVNQTFVANMGYGLAELIGHTAGELGLFAEGAMLEHVQHRLRADGSIHSIEIALRRKDGKLRELLASFELIDVGGELCVLSLGVDISDRKRTEYEIQRLNEALRERAALLEATNRELQMFSYSVSHDLSAPLRAIDGFSQVLLSEYAHRLDAQGMLYLQRIHAGAHQMAALIEGLLSLSRLTNSDIRREPVVLSTLARSIMAELTQREPKRRVEFACDEDLRAQGDARLLQAVLENLLGNAWKFTSKREVGQIKFGRQTQSDGVAAFVVRDNGAGFDMTQAHRLFGAFQRLHTQQEFPGTGIGLAVVQRIIHRHGGRVWAEGAVGQGASFYFTL
jgi:PAS domain S-box-containing protein